MSYTIDDLTAVRQAKKDLVTGNRIGQVTIMGQVIRYESVTLAEMTSLESQIIKALKPKRIKQVTPITSKTIPVVIDCCSIV